ncbi:hypothetical protein Ciccas_002204 [Cichlidogyrus casuarinus]|uniref:P-type ATPase N-terminal domain-containing protein n=1 Tax=Cichlidogyrus casuarinus TaxID=1844966 RepID=A0ABD2QHY1_9PLAT
MGNKCLKAAVKPEEASRIIYPITYSECDDSEYLQLHSHYKSNAVKTTKYTWYNFIFKNFWEQLHTFANVFFIFIVILNFMPHVEAFAREVAPVPVLIVLTLTGVIDAIEDIRRYMLDKKVNDSIAQGRYVETTWDTIHPGDFVRLRSNEIIPADILVLSSSDVSGVCHIETASLDGENNLKQREVVTNPAYGGYNKPFLPSKFCARVEVEAPNSEIYHFSGKIHTSGEPIPLRKQNLLLRGCALRNTECVEGMVVYAGHETKAMLNNTGPRFKQSKLEIRMNRDIMYCVVILAVVCLTAAVGSFIWQQSFPATNVLFLALSPNSSIIPLPLYVTLKFVKAIQLWFMAKDAEMIDPETQKGVEVHAFNIPEDLGQVEFVFCDKTGTLTENKMDFRRASVNGHQYYFRNNFSASRKSPGSQPCGPRKKEPTSFMVQLLKAVFWPRKNQPTQFNYFMTSFSGNGELGILSLSCFVIVRVAMVAWI